MSPLLSLCWKAPRRTRFKTLLHHKTWQIYLAALGLISTENLFSVFCGFHCKFIHIVRLCFYLLLCASLYLLPHAKRDFCALFGTLHTTFSELGFSLVLYLLNVCSCHHWLAVNTCAQPEQAMDLLGQQWGMSWLWEITASLISFGPVGTRQQAVKEHSHIVTLYC